MLFSKMKKIIVGRHRRAKKKRDQTTCASSTDSDSEGTMSLRTSNKGNHSETMSLSSNNGNSSIPDKVEPETLLDQAAGRKKEDEAMCLRSDSPQSSSQIPEESSKNTTAIRTTAPRVDETILMEDTAHRLMERKEYDRSLKMLAHILVIRRRRLIKAKQKQQKLEQTQQNYVADEQLNRKKYHIQKRLTTQTSDVARTLCCFGIALKEKGEYKASKVMFEQSLRMYRLVLVKVGFLQEDVDDESSIISRCVQYIIQQVNELDHMLVLETDPEVGCQTYCFTNQSKGGMVEVSASSNATPQSPATCSTKESLMKVEEERKKLVVKSIETSHEIGHHNDLDSTFPAAPILDDKENVDSHCDDSIHAITKDSSSSCSSSTTQFCDNLEDNATRNTAAKQETDVKSDPEDSPRLLHQDGFRRGDCDNNKIRLPRAVQQGIENAHGCNDTVKCHFKESFAEEEKSYRFENTFGDEDNDNDDGVPSIMSVSSDETSEFVHLQEIATKKSISRPRTVHATISHRRRQYKKFKKLLRSFLILSSVMVLMYITDASVTVKMPRYSYYKYQGEHTPMSDEVLSSSISSLLGMIIKTVSIFVLIVKFQKERQVRDNCHGRCISFTNSGKGETAGWGSASHL